MEEKQITLNESVYGVSGIELDQDIKVPGSVTENSTVVCGSCGTGMKKMGPSNIRKQTYNNQEYKSGEWQFSCRACGQGSAKVKLNPVPPMIESDSNYLGEKDDNYLSIEVGVGKNHILASFEELDRQNGYNVHPNYFNSEKHEEIDPPSNSPVEAEQMKIFQF